MKELRITTVQADLVWENKAENYKKFEGLLKSIPRETETGTPYTDVIVLPEMFTTGFSMNPKPLAETLLGETFHWMAEKARQWGAAVTGSFICVDNEHYFNRLLWVFPNGNYYKYDKRHLFSLAGEHHHYTEGVTRETIEWRNWRICPLICYDLRFPVWSRNTLQSPFKSHQVSENDNSTGYYDLLIYVANWPERRNHAWKSLLIARAIENQAYVVGVNRVGSDGNSVYYSGDTSVIDFTGEVLFSQKHTEGVYTTILSSTNLGDYRNKFGFLSDQDLFAL